MLQACIRFLCLFALTAGAPAPAGKPAQDEFIDVRGGRYRWPGPHDGKAVVLLFVGHDCPISNGYAKEIGRLCQEYTPKKIAFCIVYADADLSADDARKHAKEFGFPCPCLLDPAMVLARKVGATIKPEAALLSPLGELWYRGRIDDRYVDFGKRRAKITRQELRDALEAILAGRPIATPHTQAIGCDIDFPRK